jgi:hypothetical protein
MLHEEKSPVTSRDMPDILLAEINAQSGLLAGH